MTKDVYLLYSGDEWLSTRSLVLMGVFTSLGNAIGAVIDNLQITDIDPNDDENDFLDDNGEFDLNIYREYKIDEILRDLERNWQTQGYDENWYIQKCELDKFEEV